MASKWAKTIFNWLFNCDSTLKKSSFGYCLKVKLLNAYEISSVAGVSFRFFESLFATCRVLIPLFNTDLLTAVIT